MLPGVDAGMGVAGLEPAGDVGRKRRLAAEVQAVDMRDHFRRRTMMLGQIVDEDRLARAVFRQDRLERRALRPLVGEDSRLDPVVRQLARAGSEFTPTPTADGLPAPYVKAAE